MDIHVMKRQGLSQREIARKLGISRNTVKKYIENKDHAERDRSKTKRKSQLDPFHGNIAAWLKEDMDYNLISRQNYNEERCIYLKLISL